MDPAGPLVRVSAPLEEVEHLLNEKAQENSKPPLIFWVYCRTFPMIRYSVGFG